MHYGGTKTVSNTLAGLEKIEFCDAASAAAFPQDFGKLFRAIPRNSDASD